MANNYLTSDSIPAALYSGVQQGYCNSTINYMAKSSEMLHYLKTRPNFDACTSEEDQLTTRELYLLLVLVELEHSNFYDLDSSFFQHSLTMNYLMEFMGRTSAWSERRFTYKDMKTLNSRIRQRNMMLWPCLLNQTSKLIFCICIYSILYTVYILDHTVCIIY